MPTIELNEKDIIKMLNYITGDKYNINKIHDIKVVDKNNLQIFWKWR